MKTKYSKKDFCTDIFYDVLGSVIYAISINCFAKPTHFATGGINGLSLIINHLTGAPVGVTSLILNIPLILISFKILGKFFMLRTAKTMVIMSLILDFLAPILPRYTGDPLLAALYAGIFDGAGMVMIYLRGGSTGGLDFVTMSIRKRKPHLALGKLSMSINILILIFAIFAFKNIDAALYGAIATFSAGILVDKVMYGVGAGKILLIVTNKGKEIATAIDQNTGRGSSIMNIKGSYTEDEKQMVISAMSKSQVFTARKTAHDIDPSCFVMITSTDEVFGNGFNTHND